ncbi:hypothetical protein KAU32_01640 [bacterium]|nr:hypothetical protein [bacterium]
MKQIDLKNISIEDLAGLISRTLRKNGIKAVLVGGACVTIYSHNEYMSGDLDYVVSNPVKEIKPFLEKIDFLQEGPNRFVNTECEFYLEFLPYPVSLGESSPIENFNEMQNQNGTITLLSPTDCVKDRLAVYYH